jgi:hypothetical protein
MAHTRVIYGCSDVFISDYPSWNLQTGTHALKLLKRVQSADLRITSAVDRDKQIGSQSFAYQRYNNNPSITASITYLLSDNSNELLLNLDCTGFLTGAFNNLTNTFVDRNLFYVYCPEGQNCHDVTTFEGLNVFQINNCYITDYSVSASVGSFPTVSVSFDCLNTSVDIYANDVNSTIYGNYTGKQLSSIDLTATPQARSTGYYTLSSSNTNYNLYLTGQEFRPSAIRPGDITISFLQQPMLGGIRYSGSVPAKISDLQISIPIQRRDLDGFGFNYPYNKKVLFPLIGAISCRGIFDDPVTGNYGGIFTDLNDYQLLIQFKNTTGLLVMQYYIDNAKIESQSFDNSIGANASFEGTFSFPILSTGNFFISGAARLKNTDGINVSLAAP